MNHDSPTNEVLAPQPTGEERSISPGTPEQARTATEIAVAEEYDAVAQSQFKTGQSLEEQRAAQVESTGLRIVEPHRVLSRECTGDDVRQIVMTAYMMADLFGKRTVALAHPQVEDKEPLRFFVMDEIFFDKSNIIVNPRIVNHVNYRTDSIEGCHTWPTREYINHPRWRLIEVEYQTCEPGSGKLSEVKSATLKGLAARVFQHEVDHLNGIYCYD